MSRPARACTRRDPRDRERKAVEVFNEAIEYYSKLQQEGRIESVEPWFLATHGGDLGGFMLLRGEREKLDEIVRSPELEKLQTRVVMIVEKSGVIKLRPASLWPGGWHSSRRQPPTWPNS